MRLKTKLVLSVSALTFAIVVLLSSLFVAELLRQRIEQTVAANDVLAHEVLLMTRQAVETGIKEHPPLDRSEDALHEAVLDALRSNDALMDVMNAVVRYSTEVQDVSVTDAHGMTLVSTDPDTLNQQASYRDGLKSVRDGGVVYQTRQVFGRPRVLDLTQSLDRNGRSFLVVHVGVRSTFLKNSYAPWLRAAFIFAAIAGFASILAAGLLANLALLPIEQISRRLERLTLASELGLNSAEPDLPVLGAGKEKSDAVVRVTKTIDRLGEQMRTKEAGYTALQANLNQMLDTLRDGVLLFTADRRAVMVSDAVENFVSRQEGEMVGRRLEEIFAPETALGTAVLEAFASGREVIAEGVTLEDGREVQISLDRINDGRGGEGNMGTLLTLRDTESALQLGQELEVSRRLAAIGRLTAGVGHEVKNPINAMVVHLELLRGKLSAGESKASSMDGELFRGAQRHVEILVGEMQRLDRVVQTLADFSRPMELHLHEQDMRRVVHSVIELTGAEMAENNVQVTMDLSREAVLVRVDGELMRQALLNLLLNGMQAMPRGGAIRVAVRRDGQFAVVEVADAGEGIPAEVLPRIFELYFTTKPKGSGIGLATTYRILQMHGGAMDVRSNADPAAADRGTTFTLKVPLAAGTTGEGRKITAGMARSESGSLSKENV
ncbi:ATP-binding protein [Granulicella sp. dw_53]|uniref:sensor histidine kinase n=1 Tax=Granulicella sp. dw_53 TaxID=2719792 RepID=UPI001BD6372E|nr:ATP-binding protein [Granulicella sp. dw_53]